MAHNALFPKTFFHIFNAATLGCTKLLNDHVTLACALAKVWTVPNGYIGMTYHSSNLRLYIIGASLSLSSGVRFGPCVIGTSL